MDTLTIKKLLKSYKCFKGVFPCDRVPYKAKLPLNIIINTDPSNKPGTHWVCVSIDKNGRGFYFDSFGFPPITPQILKFIRIRSKNGWSYNKTQIQNINASTCGNYCVLYIIFRCNNMTNKQFLSVFGRRTVENDIKMRKIFKNFSLVKKYL